MIITIDESSGTPIFKQIVEQVKAAIAMKTLQPGQPIPSIRQLANEIEVNPNTVAKAYKILERDQVIESHGYRGSFIRHEAGIYINHSIENQVVEELHEVVNKLRSLGAIDSEIRNSFRAIMKEPK